jgi:hypothetical protein
MQKEPILILCDPEVEYAMLMSDYLRMHRELPWQVKTYTDVDDLLEWEQFGNLDLLVIAESAYSEKLQDLKVERMVLLSEGGNISGDNIIPIDKYQAAEEVLGKLLEVYVEMGGGDLPGVTTEETHTKFIGIYSPVRRCMQTTFALTMGQMLAEKHRTLYLNFEHFAGIRELVAETQEKDLADLLYFLMADDEQFRLRFRTICRKKGALEYIPPMKSGQNLLTVPAAEWISLMERIDAMGEYDYVIMDLTESMQGLFDILRKCRKVYTLTREDRIAKAKLLQYEQVLALYEYEDVLSKTDHCEIPQIHRIPEEVEQYTRGDLANYVRRRMEELEA